MHLSPNVLVIQRNRIVKDGPTDMGSWCDIDCEEAVRISVGRLHRKKFTKNICSRTTVSTSQALYELSGYGYIMETPKTVSTDHVHVEGSKMTKQKMSSTK